MIVPCKPEEAPKDLTFCNYGHCNIALTLALSTETPSEIICSKQGPYVCQRSGAPREKKNEFVLSQKLTISFEYGNSRKEYHQKQEYHGY